MLFRSLAAKPNTFMNLSGESVQPLLAWHKLTPNHLMVCHDELDIPLGHVRFKTGGGNAGHNGLKSITQHLSTPDFHRLRLGIGRPPRAEQGGDVSSWVLTRPSIEERETIQKTLPKAIELINVFLKEGTKEASKYALSIKP